MTSARSGSLMLHLAAGLLLAAICTAAGYLALGMGHGWDLPARYGALSFILYPLALARWRLVGAATPWRRDVALTAGVAAPVLLLLALSGALPHPARIATTGWLTFAAAGGLYWWMGHVLERRRLHAAWGSGVLLAIGVALDLLALAQVSDDPAAQASGVLILPWALLWLGWQIAAALALVRHWRPLHPAASAE